ncbi:hypothetical protein DFP73DRAFT_608422 [Morchella snyderi]|nr:hypothetical protein DFP73DRAFT_608422 [Morchella snyderi]
MPSAAPGNASEELQVIEPVPSTFIEDLCFARPSGLPIIKDLSPTNAGLFYYAVDPSGRRKGSRVVATEVVDVLLRHVGDEEYEEDTGTDPNDTQRFAPPPIASNPPQDGYKIVPLAAMTGTARTNNPLKNDQPYVQITCIQTFAEEEIKKLFDLSSDVVYSNQLFQTDRDGKDLFMSAVRVRAGNKSHNILVGLPYLGCGSETDADSISQDGIANGLKLPCYRGLEGDAQQPDYGMRVWQSWQILFDDTRLALIRSPHSPSTNCAPLFTHQPVFCSLHALALNIGNQFRHEVQPLEVLRATVNDDISNIDAEINKYVLVEPGQLTEEIKEGYGNTIKGSNFRLERHLSNMKTITTVLGKQLTILRDLTTITTNQHSPYSRPAFSNPVLLPQFDRQSEQLRFARDVFKQLISERETVLADMNKLLVDVKKSQEELRRELRELRKLREQTQERATRDALLDLLSKQEATSESTNKTLEAQRDTTKKMKNIMARQGQTISVFTFITAIFLPLGFFAQYLGMNRDVWSGVSTHEKFWRISGPITVFVMVLLIYFIYRDDDKIKLDILRITPCTGDKYERLKREIAVKDQEEKSTVTAAGTAQNAKKSNAPGQSTSLISKWLRQWRNGFKAAPPDPEPFAGLTVEIPPGAEDNGRTAGTRNSLVPNGTGTQTSGSGGSP